jgi:hypothetical protein
MRETRRIEIKAVTVLLGPLYPPGEVLRLYVVSLYLLPTGLGVYRV